MVTREVGEALMAVERALVISGMTEEEASALVDEFESRVAEELGDSDGESATEES